MKYCYLALLLLSGTLLPPVRGQNRPDSPTEAAALRAPIEACIRSWNEHNYGNLDTYTTADVDWVTNVGMWWRGREAVSRALQAYHQGMFRQTSLRSEDLSVRLTTPLTAVVHQVVFIGPYYPPDGVDQEYNRQGNNQAMITYGLLKQQSRWLISSVQVTDINPAAAAFNPTK